MAILKVKPLLKTVKNIIEISSHKLYLFRNRDKHSPVERINPILKFYTKFSPHSDSDDAQILCFSQFFIWKHPTHIYQIWPLFIFHSFIYLFVNTFFNIVECHFNPISVGHSRAIKYIQWPHLNHSTIRNFITHAVVETMSMFAERHDKWCERAVLKLHHPS